MSDRPPEDLSNDAFIRYIRNKTPRFSIWKLLEQLQFDEKKLKDFLSIKPKNIKTIGIVTEALIAKMMPYLVRILLKFVTPGTVFHGIMTKTRDNVRIDPREENNIEFVFEKILLMCFTRVIAIRAWLTARPNLFRINRVPVTDGTEVSYNVDAETIVYINNIYKRSRDAVSGLFKGTASFVSPLPSAVTTLMLECFVSEKRRKLLHVGVFAEVRSDMFYNYFLNFIELLEPTFDSWFPPHTPFIQGTILPTGRPTYHKQAERSWALQLAQRPDPARAFTAGNSDVGTENFELARPQDAETNNGVRNLIEIIQRDRTTVTSVFLEVGLFREGVSPELVKWFFRINSIYDGAFYAMPADKAGRVTGLENVESVFMQITEFLLRIMVKFVGTITSRVLMSPSKAERPHDQLHMLVFQQVAQKLFRLCLLRAVGIRAKLADGMRNAADRIQNVNTAYQRAWQETRHFFLENAQVSELELVFPRATNPFCNAAEIRGDSPPRNEVYMDGFVQVSDTDGEIVRTLAFDKLDAKTVQRFSFWFPPYTPFERMDLDRPEAFNFEVERIREEIIRRWDEQDRLLQYEEDAPDTSGSPPTRRFKSSTAQKLSVFL